MPNPILILIVTQILFTTSDFIAKYFMTRFGFNLNNFLSIWFIVYVLIRILATFGQLYIFTQLGLGRTMALMGAVSLVLSASLAFLLLGEIITTAQYIGITLVVIAFLALAFVK